MNKIDEQIQNALFKTAREGAVSILGSGEKVIPMFMAVGESGLVIEPLPMGDKSFARATLGLLGKIYPSFVTIHEVWKTVLTKEQYESEPELKNRPPSQDPNRTEALVVTLIVNGKTAKQDMLDFVRKDGKVTIGKWSSDQGVEKVEVPKGSIFPPQTKQSIEEESRTA